MMVVALFCCGNSFAQEKPITNWSEVLFNIRAESDQLLLINDQLTLERSRLEEELAGLRNRVLNQESKNRQVKELIQTYRWNKNVQSDMTALKKYVKEKEKIVERKKTDLTRLQTRKKEIEQKIATQQLQVQKLELDKKTLLDDIKNKNEFKGQKDKTELELLQEQMLSQQAQEAHIRSRIEALKNNSSQYQDGVRIDAMKTFDLRKRLAELEKQKAMALDQIAQVKSTQEILLKNKTISKIRILLDQKQALETKLSQIAFAQQEVALEPKEVSAMMQLLNGNIKEAQEQKKKLLKEMDSIKENIAILENQIAAIQYNKK